MQTFLAQVPFDLSSRLFIGKLGCIAPLIFRFEPLVEPRAYPDSLQRCGSDALKGFRQNFTNAFTRKLTVRRLVLSLLKSLADDLGFAPVIFASRTPRSLAVGQAVKTIPDASF